MGKYILSMALLFLSTNGWWYCATQQAKVWETPLALVPAISSGFLLMLFVDFVLNTWED